MSIQPKETTSPTDWLINGRAAARWSVQEVWFRYRAAGGTKGHPAIKSYFLGQTEPKVSDYLILAGVLNERLREVGAEDALLPTFEAPNTTPDPGVRLPLLRRVIGSGSPNRMPVAA